MLVVVLFLLTGPSLLAAEYHNNWTVQNKPDGATAGPSVVTFHDSQVSFTFPAHLLLVIVSRVFVKISFILTFNVKKCYIMAF